MKKILFPAILVCLLSFGFFLPTKTKRLLKVVPDPVPYSIQKSGMELRLFPIATIPPSSFGLPATRINNIRQMPGPSGNLMVNDLRGKLFRIDTLKQVHEYLDLKARRSRFIDRPGKGTGFGSFAFHPDFENNGIFFTTHTESPNGTPDFSPPASNYIPMHWILTKWTATDPSAGEFAGSREEIIRFSYPGSIHGVQDITFNPLAEPGNPDYGMLYICVGEGQSSQEGISATNLQESDRYLGTIFRIDPLGNNSANGKYGIPADNPFVGKQTEGQEIWAYGFRNPHRICFDKRNNAQGWVMFAGDIGEHNVEEVNLVEAGKNYGWNDREGNYLFDWTDKYNLYELPAVDTGYTYPVAMFDHDEGNAIVMGYVFRENQPADLQGQLLFGDIVSGRLFHLPADSLVQGQQHTIKEFNVYMENESAPISLLGAVPGSRVDTKFGYDKRGGIYFSSKADGKVYSFGPFRSPISGLITGLDRVDGFKVVRMDNYLEIEGVTAGKAYQVVNIEGKMMAKGRFEQSGSQRINLAHLPKGLYVLGIESSNGFSQMKFLK